MNIKIDDELPIEVLGELAKACGFRVHYDRSIARPDEWTLSAGHGVNHRQHVGTRKSVTAFLLGYAAMQIQTTQMLNELDNAHRRVILDMRSRLSRDP